MATAAPLALAAVPFARDRANACRRKQREKLDVALLCSKLEAAKREQEALRRQQQEQEATQSGLFVPRSAARQFTITATPLKDDLDPAKLRWTGQDEATDPKDSTGSLHVNPKHKHAALTMGMTENEVMAAATALHNPALRHLPQTQSRRGSRQETEGFMASHKRAGSKDIMPESRSDEVDTGVGFYRPGDSARRRMGHEKRHSLSTPRGGSFDIAMLATVPAYRYSRDEPNEMPYDLPMPNAGDDSGSNATRPKLSVHDRHNWAQQSQSGDDFRRTIRLPLLHRKVKEENPVHQQGNPSGIAGQRPGLLQTTGSRRASDSLLVTVKDEKQKRHDGLKALFRRS